MDRKTFDIEIVETIRHRFTVSAEYYQRAFETAHALADKLTKELPPKRELIRGASGILHDGTMVGRIAERAEPPQPGEATVIDLTPATPYTSPFDGFGRALSGLAFAGDDE